MDGDYRAVNNAAFRDSFIYTSLNFTESMDNRWQPKRIHTIKHFKLLRLNSEQHIYPNLVLIVCVKYGH